MKKSRPGTLIKIICEQKDKKNLVECIFKHTTTLGVRETDTRRYVLTRRIETVDTPLGKVRRKVSSGYDVKRVKYEHDDLEKLAEEKGMSLDEVRKALDDA